MESVDYRRISSQNLKEFLGSCARLIYQVGDDCDRVGSCLDNGPAILPGNSADRHQGLRRQFADLAKALQSDYRVWIVLAPRSENRTDGDVIDRGLVGDPQLFGVVGRNSNPRSLTTMRAAWGERSSCPTCTPSQPAATHRSARSLRNRVNSGRQNAFQFPRLREDVTRTTTFVTKLQKRDTAGH